MPQALLLSPDDQAVNAITGVLEEMAVSCERPLDSASAAQKLNSHSFDLVLVDCENLPAAKLIFDVCRRGKGANTPVPIAIVDGRAGLPTAFRLGAELILTKPVAKDQARTTIRSAVGRVRKEEPAPPAPPPELPSTAIAVAAPEARSQAAAAASFATPASTASTAAPASAAALAAAAVVTPPAPTHAAPAIAETATRAAAPTAKMSAALDETTSAPAADHRVALPIEKAPQSLPAPKPQPKEKPSKHPALSESGQRAKATVVATPPLLSSFDQPPPKKSPGRLATLLFLLAGSGLYAAWMYEPGFRAIVQPQVDRVVTLAGVAKQAIVHLHAAVSAPAPAHRASHPAPALSAAPPSATSANQAPGIATTPAPNSADTVVSTPQAAAGTPSSASTAASSPQPSPQVAKAAPPAAPLENAAPAERNMVILSSKGAEKRLVHQVPAVYPKEAKAAGLEGTVLLRTLVDDRGHVTSISLIDGNPILADSATRAVKQWRYRPYSRDGKNLPFQTIVIVDFPRP